MQRKSLKSFRKIKPGLFKTLSDNGTIQELLAKPVRKNTDAASIENKSKTIDEILRKAMYRLRFLSLSDTDPEVLLKSLDKTYQRAADIYLKCRNTLKPDSIHEFRKVSKDFLYQLSFFRPLNPSLIKSLRKTLT